ncbi:MAG: hypothetical protein AB1486_05520 [Planctomycetota bacterium]
MVEEPSSAAPPEFSPSYLNHAMNTFKKRLKLMRLDDESRVGHGAMTRGASSGIVSIQPPREFPAAVWQELVRRGRLKDDGNGLYRLP